MPADGTLAAHSHAKISARPASRAATQNLADFTGLRNGVHSSANVSNGSSGVVHSMSASPLVSGPPHIISAGRRSAISGREQMQQRSRLCDHLVGAGEERLRN